MVENDKGGTDMIKKGMESVAFESNDRLSELLAKT
jgi:hypothetical protein